jgi:trehalose 6-phosphate synthase/phosphatase
MAQKDAPPPLTLSPGTIEGGLQLDESIHPGLQSSVTEVPVTPGIHFSTYTSESSPSSYFSQDVNSAEGQMAQSPSEAAAGAKSGHDILRRMSLVGSQQDLLSDTDPRAANPSLSLSGSVISATFCIPHSLHYRKGYDWVSSVP